MTADTGPDPSAPAQPPHMELAVHCLAMLIAELRRVPDPVLRRRMARNAAEAIREQVG